MPVLTHADLTEFARALLSAGGAYADEAQLVAESLVGANLRGHDSHGVMRIPFYLERVRQGRLKPGSRLTIVHETPAAVVADGNWGFGQVLSRELMHRLMEKSGPVGVACGTLRCSAHIGRLGEYAEMAAERNLAAIICANTHGAGQRVAPVGGKRPRIGTNPVCIGMPGGADGPFILDIGTSATAEGKVRVKHIAGQPVPPGWLIDSEGRPTTDPADLYGDPPGTILPMGGEAAYKGFGLALMIEMLAGALSGGQCAYPDPPLPVGNCALYLVFSPAALGGVDHALNEVRELEEFVRGVPRIEGIREITLPGDPERRTLAERSRSGIPLDEGNWAALVKLADELGIQPPQSA